MPVWVRPSNNLRRLIALYRAYPSFQDVTTTNEFESSTEATTESRTSLVWITIPDGTVAPGPEHEYYKTYVFFHYFFRILGFFLFMGGIFLFVRFLYFSGWIPQTIGAPSAAATFKPPPAPPSVRPISFNNLEWRKQLEKYRHVSVSHQMCQFILKLQCTGAIIQLSDVNISNVLSPV